MSLPANTRTPGRRPPHIARQENVLFVDRFFPPTEDEPIDLPLIIAITLLVWLPIAFLIRIFL